MRNWLDKETVGGLDSSGYSCKRCGRFIKKRSDERFQESHKTGVCLGFNEWATLQGDYKTR